MLFRVIYWDEVDAVHKRCVVDAPDVITARSKANDPKPRGWTLVSLEAASDEGDSLEIDVD